jgi:hypothetical protein
VEPDSAEAEIVISPVCGPTPVGEVYTCSPASVKSPFWLKSIQTMNWSLEYPPEIVPVKVSIAPFPAEVLTAVKSSYPAVLVEELSMLPNWTRDIFS